MKNLLKLTLLLFAVFMKSQNNSTYYRVDFQDGTVPDGWNNYNGLVVDKFEGNNYYLYFVSISAGQEYSIESKRNKIKPNSSLKFKIAKNRNLIATFKVFAKEEDGKTTELMSYHSNDINIRKNTFSNIPVSDDYAKSINLSQWSDKNISFVFQANIDSGRGSFVYLDDIELFTDDNLGIDEITDNKFEISPNPASDFINIKNDNQVKSIEIYSLGGNLIKQLKPERTLNISYLKSGLYLFKVIDKNNTSKTFKIIKK